MEIPKDAQYRREMQEGIQIFKKSFKGAAETKQFPQKKVEFEKAGSEALKAIGDAAMALMNKKLIEQKKQLEKDYSNYIENPNTQNEKKVTKDIDQLEDTAKG